MTDVVNDVPYTLHLGDCLESMRGMADCSVDAVVTDPPYGLSFMGKKWDYDVPDEAIWRECLRVLKPGGHLLAFAGTRTQHRMAVRIEDAGFEIRDMIAWVYGSGFPKSLDVSKAIDKAAGAERTEVIGTKLGRPGMAKDGGNQSFDSSVNTYGGGGILSTDITAPATDAARQWQGWGTALKPALEPITVARKPLVGTVAENVLAHGTGAINVDGCRVPAEKATGWGGGGSALYEGGLSREGGEARLQDAGRWPANLIHDGSDEALAAFPQTPGQMAKAAEGGDRRKDQNVYGAMTRGSNGAEPRADAGSAARFFYCAKASKADRDSGLGEFEAQNREATYGSVQDARPHTTEGCEYHREPRKNIHPTVKPVSLMAYLVRLVTPPSGVVLDPFMGSGSTGKACMREGFRFVGCEMSEEYMAIADARIRHELNNKHVPTPPKKKEKAQVVAAIEPVIQPILF